MFGAALKVGCWDDTLSDLADAAASHISAGLLVCVDLFGQVSTCPLPPNALFIFYVMYGTTSLSIAVGRHLCVGRIPAWPSLSPFRSYQPFSVRHINSCLSVAVMSPTASIPSALSPSDASPYRLRLLSLLTLRLLPSSLVPFP